MADLFQIFSTREISLLFWTIIVLAIMLMSKGIRKLIIKALKILVGSSIGRVLLILVIYIEGVLFLLYSINLWSFSLLKDTLFWFFTVALVMSLTVNKAKDKAYFWKILKETFKWTIVLEFMLNLYTFSIWTELILLPILTFLVVTKTYAQTDNKYDQVKEVLFNVLALIGWTLIAIVLFKTFNNYQGFFSTKNLFAFLLPPSLTLFLLPFLYFLAVFINYELLFNRVDFVASDLKRKKELKREIILLANFNINRIAGITKKLNKFDVYHSKDLKSYVRTLLKNS